MSTPCKLHLRERLVDADLTVASFALLIGKAYVTVAGWVRLDKKGGLSPRVAARVHARLTPYEASPRTIEQVQAHYAALVTQDEDEAGERRWRAYRRIQRFKRAVRVARFLEKESLR